MKRITVVTIASAVSAVLTLPLTLVSDMDTKLLVNEMVKVMSPQLAMLLCIVVMVMCLLAFLLPVLNAFRRGHQHRHAILVLTVVAPIFLAFGAATASATANTVTMIGVLNCLCWVVALVWSVMPVHRTTPLLPTAC